MAIKKIKLSPLKKAVRLSLPRGRTVDPGEVVKALGWEMVPGDEAIRPMVRSRPRTS